MRHSLLTLSIFAMLLLLLAACSSPASTSQAQTDSSSFSKSILASGSSSQVAVSGATSSLPGASSSQSPASTPSSVPACQSPFNPFIDVPLPDGPYTPATPEGAALLAGYWYHYLNPEKYEGNQAYSCHLDIRKAGSIEFGHGWWQSDAGLFCEGNYSLDNKGILTATLREVPMGPSEEKPDITLRLLLEWPPDEQDMLIITLLEYDDSEGIFDATFRDILNQPLLYLRYDPAY